MYFTLIFTFTFNVKLSNLQLNRLKPEIENNGEVTFQIPSSVFGDPKGDNNFPHKLLLTNTQVSKLRKPFANNDQLKFNYQKLNCMK